MERADRLFVEEDLFGRLGWFIKIRWAFLAGLIIALVWAFRFQIGLPHQKILAVGGFIFAYNTALYVHHALEARKGTPDSRRTQIEANLQICADYVSLSAVIHFAGGVENPFLFLYLLHLIIGSIVLSRPQVWAHGLFAYALFLTLVLLEYSGVIPHYTLKSLFQVPKHHNLRYILAVSATLLVTFVSTIYMVSTVVRSLRAREYELMQARSMLQKKSEDLEAANRELREKQVQLVQREKLASLGQLSAGMAHEINNPIQFIQGNMRILNEAMDTVLPILDRQAEENPGFKVARLDYAFFRQHIRTLLNDMVNGTVRITDIVRDLKKFARADEGRLDEAVDVNDVVESSLRLVHNKLKHYKVLTDLDPNLPEIIGNGNKIEQVMVANLINAAEALADRPNGVIKVETSVDSGGSCVNISISDNGPGIAEENKSRLFDPFFTTKQRTGGTGLGLAIAYGIVKDHGGWIDVETRLGEGTTFRYHLPAARREG